VKVPKIADRWAYKTQNVPGTDYAILTIEVERLKKEVYRAPTAEELEAFNAAKAADKKQKAETLPKAPPLINLTDEEAEKLQAVWNVGCRAGYTNEPGAVIRMTQDEYSAKSKGGFACAKTYDIVGGGQKVNTAYYAENFPTVARVRGSHNSVVVITDKPQKPAPAVWEDPRPAARAEVLKQLPELAKAIQDAQPHYFENLGRKYRHVFGLARLVGLAQYRDSMSWGLTEEGYSLLREMEGATPAVADAAPATPATGEQMQLAL
jgi:hypothetical protein